MLNDQLKKSKLTKNGKFGQTWITDGVWGLVRVQVAQWSVGGLIDGLMVQNMVPVRESSSFYVLTWKLKNKLYRIL